MEVDVDGGCCTYESDDAHLVLHTPYTIIVAVIGHRAGMEEVDEAIICLSKVITTGAWSDCLEVPRRL